LQNPGAGRLTCDDGLIPHPAPRFLPAGLSQWLDNLSDDLAYRLPTDRRVVLCVSLHANSLGMESVNDCGEEQPEITRSFPVE